MIDPSVDLGRHTDQTLKGASRNLVRRELPRSDKCRTGIYLCRLRTVTGDRRQEGQGRFYASPEAEKRECNSLSQGETMLRDILYVHGFGSRFNPDSDKIAALNALGPVRGENYDFTATYPETMNHLLEAVEGADLLVGTSLGGYFAARLGSQLGMPFVSVNPAISPASSLRAHLGSGTDHYGASFVLAEQTLESYPDYTADLDPALGLVLVDEGDEVIPVDRTLKVVRDAGIDVITFPGGDHRFRHMREAIPSIRDHLRRKQGVERV